MATAGAAGAQVPVPGADALPTGGVDSLAGAPAALCSGPLGAIGGLSGVCEVAGDDQVQVGDSAQVLPSSDQSTAESQVEPESAVNVDLEGDTEPGPCEGDDCDVPDENCDECQPPETTVPTTPSTETTVTTVTTTPPTTAVEATMPTEEQLPRTGSTVAPFVVAGAALLAVGAALVASKRFALGRR